MNEVTAARGGLMFDVATSNFDDFTARDENLLMSEDDFYKAAMLMKANCERILKGVKEYEDAYNAIKK